MLAHDALLLRASIDLLMLSVPHTPTSPMQLQFTFAQAWVVVLPHVEDGRGRRRPENRTVAFPEEKLTQSNIAFLLPTICFWK